MSALRRFQTAFLSFAILFLLDIALVFLTNRREFLTGAGDALMLIAMGISLAFLLGLVFGPLFRVWRSYADRITQRFPNPALGVWANAGLLLVAGVLVANSRRGQLFNPAPVHHTLGALTPGLLYLGIAKLHFRRFGAPPKFIAYAAAAFATGALTLVAHTEELLKGRFGMGGVSAYGLLGLVTGTLAFFYAYGIISCVPLGRRWDCAVTALLMLSLGMLQFVNSYFYVDLYFTFHVVISLISFLMALHLAKRITARFPIRSPKHSRWVAIVLFTLSSCCVLSGARPDSVTGYIAGVHTVSYQAALTPFYRLEQSLQDARELAFIFYRRVLKRKEIPFFISPAEKLPGNFVEFALSESERRPTVENLVIFVLDAKRPRDIGLYEESPVHNPSLEKYFSDAFVFNNAFSVGNRTKHSLPALYSGAYWDSVRYNFRIRHAPFWYSYQDGNAIGHVFKKNGFQTIVLSNDHYYRNYFIKQEMAPLFGGFKTLFRDAEGGGSDTRRLIRSFEQHRNEVIPDAGPFLTVVHLFEHTPRMTAGLEEMVRRVCDTLTDKSLYDRTVIVITSDHGTQHREHGRTTYGTTLFNEEIRVPYILRIPGMTGRPIDDAVASIDHFPFFLDLFGIDADIALEGRSYLPLLNGKPADPERPIFVQSHSPSLAVIADHMKLIRWYNRGPYALFDLKDDPGEKTSRVGVPRYREVFVRLKSLLEEFDREHPFF